jgi:hypothetical protein
VLASGGTVVISALVEAGWRRVRVAEDRLGHQRSPGRVDRQVQPAHHSPDRHVQDAFCDAEDLLDPGGRSR